MYKFLAILALALSATAFDIDDGEDLEYATWFPKLDQKIDLDWIFQIPSFYEPFLSKLIVKRTAHMFLSPLDFKNLNESRAEYSHCTRFSFRKNESSTSLTKQSFGQEPLTFLTIIHKSIPGRWDLLRVQKNGETAHFLTMYVVLFCKNNGMLTVHTFIDGSMTFALASPKEVIPTPEFIQKAKKMLLKLGFKPENFVYSNYSGCTSTFVTQYKEN